MQRVVLSFRAYALPVQRNFQMETTLSLSLPGGIHIKHLFK